MNCVFCKINNGEIPAKIIYKDGACIAFLDNKPHTKGHTVVIPKLHGVTIFDFDESNAKEIMASVKSAMELIQEKLNPDGFNVGWNHNTAGGQVVPHLHIHIMPRYNGDGGGSQHSIINNPGDISVEQVAKIFEEN